MSTARKGYATVPAPRDRTRTAEAKGRTVARRVARTAKRHLAEPDWNRLAADLGATVGTVTR